jgi:cytochrome c oxidase subunit 2
LSEAARLGETAEIAHKPAISRVYSAARPLKIEGGHLKLRALLGGRAAVIRWIRCARESCENTRARIIMTFTRSLAACFVAAALLGLPTLASAQEADAANGAKHFALCAQCHGSAGEGNQAIGAPAIAGMPAWYVQSQVVKFSNGLRGKHFDDHEGLRMRPMALWLIAGGRAERVAKGEAPISSEVDANIRDVAAHVGALPPTNPAPTITGGNVAAGEAQWALCGSCHGMQGEGSEPQSAPPLAGQSDWYLVASMKKFKSMTRGYDGPNDPFGATMAGMSNVLADDQAVKDVVAFISTLKK